MNFPFDAMLKIEEVIHAGMRRQRQPLGSIVGGFDADLLDVDVHLLVRAGAVGQVKSWRQA